PLPPARSLQLSPTRRSSDLVQNHASDQGGDVRIDNGGGRAGEAVPQGHTNLRAASQFFANAFEDQNVRVHRHTYRKHQARDAGEDRKSTRLNSSHVKISYAV